MIRIPVYWGTGGSPIKGAQLTDRPSLLDQFWVGPENALVPVAVARLLKGQAGAYGPVVFFGPSGSGKSHLAFGLAAAYKARFPDQRVVQNTAVEFARELAEAIETQAVPDFQQRYRRASLLVLDDIDRLAGRQTSQRELSYTLDAILQSGGQIVLTSSVPGEQLSGFIPNLKSRLVGGLTLRLALPGPQTRLAIIEHLADAVGLKLARQDAQVLAVGLSVPVPGLLDAISTLGMASGPGGSISAQSVRQYLSVCRSRPAPSLRRITAAAAKRFSLSVAQVRGPLRSRAVTMARHAAIYLARTLTATSLRQIGAHLSGRDHTTVAHGYQKAQSLLESDPVFRCAVEELRVQLQAP
ncbi:MAG: DnaA/Hda family protein [Thermoguttaceae bacterium]